MSDDDPISYLALTKGTPVLSASGAAIGAIEHVLQDDDLDFFDGVVVKTSAGIRFVDANQIDSITVGAVLTTVTDAQADSLPAPDGEPVLSADPDENTGSTLTAWFGRTFLREHWTRKRDV